MIADIITDFRVVISFALLFFPVFSPAFYMLYLIAGLSDMIDGTIARRMNTVSGFGAKFDTVADFVFTVVCLIKLLPVISVPVWLCVWIVLIALIKIINIDHEMTKTHFISFVAAVSSDRCQMVKLYPEGEAEARFKINGVRKIYFYCNRDGLFGLKSLPMVQPSR